METLKNNKLLLDKDCPMCQLYGSTFEKLSIIDKNTCYPYNQAIAEGIVRCDFERAKNEIALIDTATQEVRYGVDALLVLADGVSPFLSKIMKWAPFYYMVKKLYKFISMNRKVIAPSNSKTNVCIPELNLTYRFLYFVFVVLISSKVLNIYFADVYTHFRVPSNLGIEAMICGLQFVWQALYLKNYRLPHKLDYLGNMATVSLLGSLLLIPLTIIESGVYVKLLYFHIVVFLMLLEHTRRVKILELPWHVSLSWVAYRCLVLLMLYITTTATI
ncbi:MAG: hypothetical protein ACRCVT_00090 [Leadbetterella sp.]